MSKVSGDDKIRELKQSIQMTLSNAAAAKEGWIEDVCMMLTDVAEILASHDVKFEWFKEKTDMLEKEVEALEDRISQLESRDLM